MARIRLYTEDLRPAALPLACLVCGRPSVTHVTHTFTWRPAWSSPLILVIAFFGCFPLAVALVIVSIVRARRRTLACPLCDRHQHYWAWRGFWVSVPLLVLSAAVITLSILILTEKIPLEMFTYLFVATALLLAGWAAIAALLNRGSIRCLEISEESMLLEPVSAEFAAGVQLERRSVRTTPEAADLYETDPGA